MNEKKFKILNSLLGITGMISLLVLLYDFGFDNSSTFQNAIGKVETILACAYFTLFFIRFTISNSIGEKTNMPLIGIVFNIFFIVILILIVFFDFKDNIVKIGEDAYTPELLFHNFVVIYLVFNMFISFAQHRERWLFISLHPSKIFVYSFAFIILLGSGLLVMPECTYNGISYIDALFTSTTSVCVTGLTTINVADIFTFKGKIIILLLIQAGGLGIVTLTTFIALYIRKGFTLNDQIILKEVMSDENMSMISGILKSIIRWTFAIETVGAGLLFFFLRNASLSFTDRFFYSIFHSVSAFCNAGISIIHDGFQDQTYSSNIAAMIVVMLLIVFGGLGFYTFTDVFKNRHSSLLQIRETGLRLQTRIILWSTIILIFGGAFFIWLFQRNIWADQPIGNQIYMALFSSVTSRTAGFSITDIGLFSIPAGIIVILLMFIGASPNSTAGGIKTTTFITLLASLRDFVLGRNRVEIGWNYIPMNIVRRAFIVLFSSLIIIFIAQIILNLTESSTPFDLFFETISAFGTVGLTRGITPSLTVTGKLVIIFVMFLGRVGVFTIATIIKDENMNATYKFPETTIMVG